MPGYLSAADAGIAFYRPGVSRLGTSPVKVSEYLACGLPVVMNRGIGDSDRIIMSERAGVLVDKFDEAAYVKAAAALDRLVDESVDTRRQNQAAAEKLFDLKAIGATRYAKLYTELLGA